MKETKILYPLNDKTQLRHYKEIYNKIRDELNSKEFVNIENIDQLLNILNISEEEYIKAIRSNIKKPTIFLKRNINETRINPYNKLILELWRANTDIQFILSP